VIVKVFADNAFHYLTRNAKQRYWMVISTIGFQAFFMQTAYFGFFPD